MDENNSNTDQSKEGDVEQPKVVDPRPTAPQQPAPEPSVPPQQNVVSSSGDVSRMDDPTPSISGQHSTFKSKSKLLWGGVAAIVVLLFAAGAYAFVQYNQPENRITRALVSGLDQEQLAATFGLNLNLPEEGVTTELSGEVQADEDALYFSFGIESLEAGAIALSSNFQPQLEFVALNGEDTIEEAFFKLSGVDKTVVDQYLGTLGSSQSQVYDDLYETYHDQWIDVSEQLSELEEGDDQAPDLSLSDSDREKLTDIVKDSSLVIIEEELESKDINDSSADGFVVSPDFDGIVEMLRAVEAAELEIVDELNNLEGSEIDFDELVESVEEAKDEYEDSSDQLEVQLWLDSDEFVQLVLNLEDPDGEGDFNFTMTAADYDESMVEAPTDSLSFEDLQNDFTSALFGGSAFAPQPGFDSQTQFDTNDTIDTFNLQ